VTGKKPRPGRPSVAEGETSKQVGVRVAPDMYDRAFAKARRDRVSIPDLMRRALYRALREEKTRKP
jgi:predicted HicB family RNase H-like nuclease